MLDFIFALMAAGINSADGAGSGAGTADAAIAQATPPAVIAPLVAPDTATQAVPSPTVPETGSAGVIIGQGVVIAGVPATPTAQAPLTGPSAPAAPAMNMSVVPAGLTAEPQTPSGKFTTAAEVKPILTATKANWVAVREYEGQDLLYVSTLWSWRCGLHAMAISVNDEPMQNWPLPACHTEFATPNAILDQDGLPYLTLKLGAVNTIDIQIVYDDLSMDAARYERGNVLIP